MPKEWKINSQRRDPNSKIICCKYGCKPTRWYKLMTTTVYRCEKHKTMIESPVYDQGKLSSKGECIGMEFNLAFEAGVQREQDYFRKSGKKFDLEALEHELTLCKDDHKWIKEEKEIKGIVDHLREKHPILFSHQTYYDEKGEHNLIAEHPDEYFLCKISQDQIHDHYQYTIPPEYIGTDLSASDLKLGVRSK